MAKQHKSEEYIKDSDDSEDEGFQPPKHFKKVDISANFPSKLEDNKELWLFKVPKGFPLAKLKTIPVSFTAKSISNGPSPFKLEGDTKSFQVNEEFISTSTAETSNANKYSVLVKQKNAYRPLSKNSDFSRFYNIRESVQVPEIDMHSVVKPRQNVKKIKKLRMRHFASGYYANDYEEADPNNVSDISEEEVVEEHVNAVDDDDRPTKKAKIDKKEKKEKKSKKEKKEKKEKKDKSKDRNE